MTLQNRNPNHFQPSKFVVIFGSPYDELNQYVLNCTIPELDLGSTYVFPANNSRIPYAGNEITRSDLAVSFMLDEYFRSYTIIHDWINSIKNITEETADPINYLTDIRIECLDSTETNAVAKFVCTNSFPSGITGPVLAHEDNTTHATSFTVFFKQQYVTFEPFDVTQIQRFKDE